MKWIWMAAGWTFAPVRLWPKKNSRRLPTGGYFYIQTCNTDDRCRWAVRVQAVNTSKFPRTPITEPSTPAGLPNRKFQVSVSSKPVSSA